MRVRAASFWAQLLSALGASQGIFLGSLLCAEEIAGGRLSWVGVAEATSWTALLMWVNEGWVRLVRAKPHLRHLTAQDNGRVLSRWMEVNSRTGGVGICYVIFAVVLRAPIVEEAIFRGVLFYLLDGAPPGVIVLVTAVLFSLMHGVREERPVTQFVMGLLYGILRVRHGIWAACLAHGLFNTYAIAAWVRCATAALRQARDAR